MEPVTKILLKNGINEMIRENELYFKENITQTLAIKLNSAINEAKNSFYNQMLLPKQQKTKDTKSLKVFVSFLESFKPGKFKFKDDSVINITEADIESIKKLFENLNSKNREKMVKEIFENPTIFKQHIEFSKSTKGLL